MRETDSRKVRAEQGISEDNTTVQVSDNGGKDQDSGSGDVRIGGF